MGPCVSGIVEVVHIKLPAQVRKAEVSKLIKPYLITMYDLSSEQFKGTCAQSAMRFEPPRELRARVSVLIPISVVRSMLRRL